MASVLPWLRVDSLWAIKPSRKAKILEKILRRSSNVLRQQTLLRAWAVYFGWHCCGVVFQSARYDGRTLIYISALWNRLGFHERFSGQTHMIKWTPNFLVLCFGCVKESNRHKLTSSSPQDSAMVESVLETLSYPRLNTKSRVDEDELTPPDARPKSVWA